MKTKWIRDDCVPDKNDKLRFPLVHWACIFGRHRLLEYLVSEKGFQLTVKVGKNQEGPLFSMVQHLSTGMHPKCSREYLGSVFGNVVDIFLKYIPEGLFERESCDNNTILHVCAKRCSADPHSRKFLEVLLLKIKESDKFPPEKEEEILSAVNKKGDTFLHLMVADEMSTETLTYFFSNFSKFSENISKAKNNFGKTPRQIAVEKKSFKMLKALGAPDVVIKSLQNAMNVVPNHTQKNSLAANKTKTSPQKDKGAPKTVAKPSSSVNSTSSDKENQNSKTSSNQTSPAVKNAKSVSFAEQPEVFIINGGQLQTEDLKMCSCDPAPSAEEKEQPSDSNTPTKRPLEPFPQRYPATNVINTAPEKSSAVTEKNVSPSVAEKEELMDVEDVKSAPDLPGEKEADTKPEDRNVFLSLSNSIKSFTKKRPAPGGSRARGPRQKRGRTADLSSDSDSDAEDDPDFALDDDSDDDMESAEDEEEEVEEEELEDLVDKKGENYDTDDVQQEEKEGRSLEEPDVEVEASK